MKRNLIDLEKELNERKETEETLRKEYSFREGVIEKAAEGICVSHDIEEYPYLKFTVWNDRMTEITGYTMDEINRLGWYQTVYPDPEVQARVVERMAKVRQGLDLHNEEWEITRADGEKRNLSISTSILVTNDGVNHVLTLMHDQTDRIIAEKALQDSEARYRAIFEQAADAIVLVDAETGALVEFNNKAYENLGYSREEFGKLKIPDFEIVESDEDVKRHIKKIVREGAGSFETKHRTKSGDIRHVYVSSRAIRIREINFIQSIWRDITDLKKADEALRLQNLYFQQLFESSLDAILIVDAEDRILDVNKAFERLFQFSIDEIHGSTPNDFIVPENFVEEASNLSQDALQGTVVQTEVTRKRKDNSLVDVEVVGFPTIIDEEVVGAYVIYRDITERKRAEDALRGSEEKFRRLVEDLEDNYLVYSYDLENNIHYVSPGAKNLFGYEPHELIGKNWRGVINLPPESLEKGSLSIQMCREGRNPPRYEYEYFHPSGERRVLKIHDRPVFDEKGNVIGIEGISEDITERKKAEEAIRISEERLRTIFKAAENVSFLIAETTNEQDSDPRIVEFSPGSEKIFCYKREEMIGQPVSILHLPEDAAKFPEMHRKMREGREGYRGEITLVKNSGEKFPALLSTHPLFDEKGEMYAALGVSLDMHEQKRLETQLRQGEKMEAIGTLAGGIAHEFNNALMAIIGNIELIKMSLTEDEHLDKYTDSMKVSSQRMAQLTDQLLAYAGGGKYRPKIIPLNDFVEDTIPIVRHVINPDIRVETNLTSDILNIEADFTQMQMVLSAVLSNASEAIEGRGKIRITTRYDAFDNDFAASHPELKTCPHVCLIIQDDGKGMDEETKSKIFEPFFTSKFQGRGLGMAAAYGIVMNHEGGIEVDSELGKGTEVRIYLPAIDVEIKEKEAPNVEVSTGTGTILLIEDEQIVLEVTRAMLEKLGYRVLEAPTGQEAIDIAERFDGEIDLALLDIKLPDMEGGSTYTFLKKARPNLKVIVCSGYAIDGPAQDILDAGAQDFVQKPYSLETLSAKLKAALEGK